MYTFHRTSKEKLQNEAPLLVVSWNFISTLKRTNKKKKYPTNRKTARHYFLLSALGNCTRCTSVSRMSEEGQSRRTQHPGPQQHQRAFQSGTAKRPAHPPPGAAGNIHAVCVGEGRWRKSLMFTSMNTLRSKAFCSSRSLHIQWPSCHQSPSRCTCRLSRCHSSGQMKIPWTV